MLIRFHLCLSLFTLGAIFTPGSEEMQTAFNYAISFHNNNETQARFKVEPVVEVLDSDDSYKIGQTCKWMYFFMYIKIFYLSFHNNYVATKDYEKLRGKY